MYSLKYVLFYVAVLFVVVSGPFAAKAFASDDLSVIQEKSLIADKSHHGGHHGSHHSYHNDWNYRGGYGYYNSYPSYYYNGYYPYYNSYPYSGYSDGYYNGYYSDPGVSVYFGF